MTLKTACEIADECGLETIGEAILNIELHAIQLYTDEEAKKELRELYSEVLNYGKDWREASIRDVLEEK